MSGRGSEDKRVFEGRPLYTEVYNQCRWNDPKWLVKHFEPDWLDATLNYWAERLRIQDWTIHVEWCSAYDMKTSKVHGMPVQASVRIWPQHKCVYLDILNFAELHPRTVNYDFELTLIHELLHISMWQWSIQDRDEMEDYEHEACITRISEALLLEHRNIDQTEFWSSKVDRDLNS